MQINSLYETLDTMTMISAWDPSGLVVSNLTSFDSGRVTCVIGVNGRGSLQITEDEFVHLLSAMNEMERVRQGGKPNTDRDPSA